MSKMIDFKHFGWCYPIRDVSLLSIFAIEQQLLIVFLSIKFFLLFSFYCRHKLYRACQTVVFTSRNPTKTIRDFVSSKETNRSQYAVFCHLTKTHTKYYRLIFN